MKKYKVVFVLIVILLMGVGYFFLKESQQENFTYTYTDKTYNYKITFPSSWKDIKVISDIGQNQSFALPTIDVNWLEDIGSGQKVKGYGAVFFLRRITLSEWDNMRKACGEKNSKTWESGCFTDTDYLGKNSSYYFVALYPSAGPTDSTWISLSHEISEEYLKNNFKLIGSK